MIDSMYTPTDSELDDRVETGMNFLDANYGEGWVNRIDPNSLDMGDPRSCVGAQLEGEFSLFQEKHGMWGHAAVIRGLDVWAHNVSYLDDLTTKWQDAIRARQAVLAAS